MSFDELTPMQQLAVAQALYKVLAQRVSTKDPDSLRGQVDEQVRDLYEQTGARSYDVSLKGMKVGTLSVTVAKEASTTVYDLADADAFDDWLASLEGREAVTDYVYDHAQDLIRYVIQMTGEVPEGVEPRVVTTPERVKGTTVRVDVQKVARALGPALPSAVAGLLGGE